VKQNSEKRKEKRKGKGNLSKAPGKERGLGFRKRRKNISNSGKTGGWIREEKNRRLGGRHYGRKTLARRSQRRWDGKKSQEIEIKTTGGEEKRERETGKEEREDRGCRAHGRWGGLGVAAEGKEIERPGQEVKKRMTGGHGDFCRGGGEKKRWQRCANGRGN